jgi:hypothetical protein
MLEGFSEVNVKGLRKACSAFWVAEFFDPQEPDVAKL